MNRIQQVKKSFPDFVDPALEIAEPTHKNKYLLWIAQQLEKKHGREDIAATVLAFHKNAKRLKHPDIYSYEDLKELEGEIKDLDDSRRRREQIVKGKGSRKIYEDDRCLVVRVDSKLAMIFYGKDAQWCISMQKNTYWEEYSWQGNVFYVLIDKQCEKPKQSGKYCIQKLGLFSVNVWTCTDNRVLLEQWIRKNRHFESAVMACIQDSEASIWSKILECTADKQEVREWLKYQHKDTVKWITDKSPIYAIDPTLPLEKVIKRITPLKKPELEALVRDEPEFMNRVADYLSETKFGYKRLRANLGSLLPERAKDFMLPLQLLEEKVKTDPSAVVPLLLDQDSTVWKKYAKKAEPKYLLKVLLQTRLKYKREFLAEVLESKVKNCVALYKFIAEMNARDDINVPEEIWGSK